MEPIVIYKAVTVLRKNDNQGPNDEPFVELTKAIQITIDPDKLFDRIGKRAANVKSGRSSAIDGAIKARVVNRVPL